jgi:micrococcal nuclease
MPEPPGDAFGATVERVVDGDTFVAVRDGRRVRVRLIGVDAPESVKPDAPVECYGREASALLTRLLPGGGEVRAAYQTEQHRDPNGRDLWDVWLPDGRFLQAVLVRDGAADARRYRPQVAHAEYLDSVERLARESGEGLHGAC